MTPSNMAIVLGPLDPFLDYLRNAVTLANRTTDEAAGE